jgi:WD40 repeat protein
MLAFLPDGRQALSAGWGDPRAAGRGFWRVFEVPGGGVIRDVKVENTPFVPADLSRDGKRLLSYGADGRGRGLTLWDVASGKIMRNYEAPYPIMGGQFSPDGKKALIYSIPGKSDQHNNLRLWDLEAGQEICALEGGATFAPDSKSLLWIQSRGLLLWDIKTREAIRKIDDVLSERWLNVAFTPDGKGLVAVADRHLKRIDLKDDKVVWSAELVEAKLPQLGQQFLNTVVFSPDRTIAFVAVGIQLARIAHRAT